MKSFSLVAAFAAVVIAATPALAQPAAAPPPPSAHQLELSHRLIAAMHMTDTMNGIIQPLVAQMVDMQTKQLPGFKPEWRQPLIEATQESMNDLFPKLMSRMEVVYAQVLSEDELNASIAFYESSAGQSILRKLPQALPLVLKDFQSDVVASRADIMTRFCKKIGGCDKAGAAPGS
jgi:hypothetical protein